MSDQIESDTNSELASDEQLSRWIERFADYRQRPTRETLLEWLGRFSAEHLTTAHKLLDAVIIVSERDIHQGYNSGLSGMPGWSKSASKRTGRWYFVGVGSAGESGQAMLRIFREANGLQADGWGPYFVTARELAYLDLSALDQVVFVDDFAGTGTQIVGYWPLMKELVASDAKMYLLLTAVTSVAVREIADNTDLDVRYSILLNPSDNIFSDQSTLLTERERSDLDYYGRIAWQAHPRGFGNCGLTLVLSHKTQNNTIPILHANHSLWKGVFPRTLISNSRG